MGFFNKLGGFLRNTLDTAKIIDGEFSISNTLINSFAKKGINPKVSKPMKDIIAILDAFHIKYDQEKIFNECYNHRKLPFDFCIYTTKGFFLVEYDGVQHYKPCFGLSEEQKLENFQNTLTNDAIKNDYCKKHKIRLYRITYKENHVERILEILKAEKLI